jgi:hypothetical protein
MSERRNANRKTIDLPVTKQAGDLSMDAWASDISPTGVRLRRFRDQADWSVIDLELHLVPGAISTVIQARRVWKDEDFEAFAFENATFSQQAILERMFENY